MAPYSTNQYPTASPDGTSEKFTSKERDSETGLDYFGARYMSSTQGRFTSPDPLMASAKISDPQTWNRYTYGLNNPLQFIDENGMAPCDDTKTECVHMQLNIIYDENARKGKGLTEAQKKAVDKIVNKLKDEFGNSGIALDVSYTKTGGKISQGDNGGPIFEGQQKGALNVFASADASYATGGDAGRSGKTADGTYVSVIDMANGNYDGQTTSHELAHQFLRDPDRKPGSDATLDSMFHYYREADIGVRNAAQRLGWSQQDYREGAKKFAVPVDPRALKPQK